MVGAMPHTFPIGHLGVTGFSQASACAQSCGTVGLLDHGSDRGAEGGERFGPALVLGALRNFARDDRWPQCPFGSIVGWLNGRVERESHYAAAIIVPAPAWFPPLP
jgi:hypothetical protein